MGSESSVLENCRWGDVIETPSETNWKLRRAILKDDVAVTVFQHKRKNKTEVDLLLKATQNLRTLRHPNLLRFISSGENSDGSYLVTEGVEPLECSLCDLQPLEICAGLHSILDALNFLHHTVGISHNNVSLSSIYVTSDGSWKLGGLEHSCRFQDATAVFLDKCLARRDEDTISPEEKQGKVSPTVENGHARDVYAFGVLAYGLEDRLDNLGDLATTFKLCVQEECLNFDPDQRPQVERILEDKMFRNNFLEVLGFLKTVATKSEDEKKTFFRTLTDTLLRLPEDVVAKRLAVPLVSRFVMLDATANQDMLPSLLTPYRDGRRPTCARKGQVTPILSHQLFKTHLIPELFRIFHIRDLHIRKVLLAQFSSYVNLFDIETLEDTIFPQLLLGLRDTDDGIVASSLQSLSYLVPILGGDFIIGGPRKRFFTEGMPKFKDHRDGRTKNTPLTSVSTILGGKKILLKDLALLSNGTVISDEKEAKRKERTLRKEEARQRQQERRRKTKEQMKNKQNKVSNLECSNEIEDSVTQDRYDSNICEVKVLEQHSRNSEKHVDERQDNIGDVDDWSEDSHVSEDGDLSDEIENELRGMPSTISQSFPNENVFTSAPQMDWSDASHPGASSDNSNTDQSKTRGALRLGGGPPTTPKQENKVVDFTAASEDLKWGKQWEDVQTVIHSTGQADPAHHSSNPSTGLDKQTSVIKSTIPSDLGSEFTIKGIKVKSPLPSEVDFFSDMTPDIRIGHKDPLAELEKEVELKEHPQISETFAMKSTGAVNDVVEGDGWGDGLDWGADF